jgi:hypothetical protein
VITAGLGSFDRSEHRREDLVTIAEGLHVVTILEHAPTVLSSASRNLSGSASGETSR